MYKKYLAKHKNRFIFDETGKKYTFASDGSVATFGELEKRIIENYLKQKNINFKKRKMFNSEQIQTIINLKNQGLSNTQIAKNFNCCEGTIRNYLKNF